MGMLDTCKRYNGPCERRKGETVPFEDVAKRMGEAGHLSREYMCSICYRAPEDPVRTHCGHLFCWTCIYTWSQLVGGCKFCPTCRSGMEIDEVMSILAINPKEKTTVRPPRPPNTKKPVKIIMPGMKINGTRFGNLFLQEDEVDMFSYRTALGLFVFVCMLFLVILRSHFFE